MAFVGLLLVVGLVAADRLCRWPGGAGSRQQHLCPHRAAAQPGERCGPTWRPPSGRVGFDVTTVRDADRVAMNEALRAFTRESAGADLALVFYAGHDPLLPSPAADRSSTPRQAGGSVAGGGGGEAAGTETTAPCLSTGTWRQQAFEQGLGRPELPCRASWKEARLRTGGQRDGSGSPGSFDDGSGGSTSTAASVRFWFHERPI